MRSTLCEAVARCHLRRLRGVAAAAPLPAAIVALVVVTAPVILFRLGGAVGDEVADSIGAAGVSDALVLGPLLAAAVAGAALAVAAPRDRRSAIRSPQARRARRSPLCAHARSRGCRLDRRRALSGRPLRRARARASRRSCRRRCARCGDARRRSRRRRRRRRRARRRRAGSAAARSPWVSGSWAGSWWVSLSEPAPLGPLALVPPALRGAGSPWLALGVSSGVGIGLSAAWVALAATRAEPRSRCRGSGALRSTAPAGADCRGRAARTEGRSEARDARGSALRPRRVGACGRDRRASARIVLARHDDRTARIAPVPTRRRRGARRRPLALAGRTRPERCDRAVVRAREHPCGRAPGRGRRQRRRCRLWCARGNRRHRRRARRRRLVRGTARRRACSRGAAREPEIR